MEWSKLKNMILLMLAFVNAVLLLLVGAQERQVQRYLEDTRQAALTVLEQEGISFALDQMPDNLTLPSVTVMRDRTGERTIAQALLGETVQEEGSEVRSRYRSPNGTAEFSMNGSFSIAFQPSAWRLEEGQDYTQGSQACLTALGISATLEAQHQVGSQLVLTYRQQWEGYPLFSCLVSLHWQGDQLLLVEGQMLKGAAATTRNSPLLSTPAILVRFLEGMNQGGYVCSRIDTMTPGYLSSGLTSSVQLTPVWQLTTDTGTYFIDALTGVFTAAS